MNEPPILIGETATPPLRPELHFEQEDIEDIASFFQLPACEVEERLRSYKRSEMGVAWNRANPQSPDEIRAFYASTELYVWELIQWHAEPGYERYWQAVERLMELCPPASHARVLDYGCGVGDSALRFARAGYDVTIADVPGRTLDFARARFARRRLPVRVVEVQSERPALPRGFDVLICFDVLEHVPAPDHLLFQMADALKAGGVAAIEASFFTDEEWPHHLAHNVRRWAETGTWWIAVNAAGFDKIEEKVYRKMSQRRVWQRRLRYHVWQHTGWFLQQVPRFAGDHIRN